MYFELSFESNQLHSLARERRFEVDDRLSGALVDAAARLGVEPVLPLVRARKGHRERVANNFEHHDA